METPTKKKGKRGILPFLAIAINIHLLELQHYSLIRENGYKPFYNL